MIIYSRLLALAVRYGARFVSFVKNNRTRILNWVRDGLALDAIIARIKAILGIK